MLRALELVGFKSFADKTRFEFPPGITVVVGPNGSGKSNVVDAIKWVLGEQSVKSLRGKEMADVIFNGSVGRKSLNSCETTLVFDNSKHLLPLDTSEVAVTRRVYRSGEGEYLINRQPCRLRDIRDLFAGTGVATEAYSVIEQGKVDVMLQSSPRDRRVIFEEAAGISRFKAKKLESLRRLDRVEQNLLRLSDIVQEVDARLRGVRAQAAKARRYKEHTDRLQELRTQIGLADWRQLSDRLAEIEGDLTSLGDELSAATAQAELHEARAFEMEGSIGDATDSIRNAEGRLAAVRERIATTESTIEHQRARVCELEEQSGRHRRQLAAMNIRAGDLEQQLRQTSTAVDAAEAEHRQTADQLTHAEAELSATVDEFSTRRSAHEQLRAEYVEKMRAAAALASEISALESQLAAAAAAHERRRTRLAETQEAQEHLAAELVPLRERLAELLQLVEAGGVAIKQAQQQWDDVRARGAQRQKELGHLQRRHAGATERAEVLEELERRLEGLSSGAKEILMRSRAAADGPFRQVRGLVADLMHVNVEAAGYIEAALGPMAGYLVVAPGDEFFHYLGREAHSFKGRVGFVRLDVVAAVDLAESVDFFGRHGVVGRADQFVEADPDFAQLAERILGRTWVVEHLDDALRLAEELPPGCRFVTLDGELVGSEGTLSVGPRGGFTGLISRRSELRALRETITELDAAIDQAEVEVATLDQLSAEADERLQSLRVDHGQAADALAEHRVRVNAAQQRHHELNEQQRLLSAELAAAQAQRVEADESLQAARQRHSAVTEELRENERLSTAADEAAQQVDERRRACEAAVTTAKVHRAKSEERLENLRTRLGQFEQDRQERQRTIADCRGQLIQCLERTEESTAVILQAEGLIAEFYLEKEKIGEETIRCVNQRESLRARRSELLAQAQTARGRSRALGERRHKKELAAGEIQLERAALADRLREDYEIELAELEHEPSDEELHRRDEIDQEIADLRRKIANIGNVNLEALDELDQLEARYETLSLQYDDLNRAKTSLEQIIERINTDSRRLFSETLEAIRGNFQALFRKLFGGGQADIVLEEGVDILESGIEIIARPPGTKPAYIAQLSGGQRALTCVALLMAIFQYRPSPFCVLDEVDAPLDEANIERFMGVLQEFLAWTQFIIVTHSKKTMTCATTLYGVTMQESGVSKQVSVRFEDVSDDGEIQLTRDRAAGDDETQAA